MLLNRQTDRPTHDPRRAELQPGNPRDVGGNPEVDTIGVLQPGPADLIDHFRGLSVGQHFHGRVDLLHALQGECLARIHTGTSWPEDRGFSDEQFFGQTDLQIAAAAWLGQQRTFAQLIETCPDRVRSLGSESFLANPAETLTAASALFGVEMSQDHIKFARQNALTRNSKDGKPFAPGGRKAEYRAARAAYGDEIDKVRAWADAVADAAKIMTELPADLI